MAYTPKQFKPGDVITASQLNAINEQIVQANIYNNTQIMLYKIASESLGIEISGLTPGKTYSLVFYRRARSGNGKWLRIDSEYGYGKMAGAQTKLHAPNINMDEASRGYYQDLPDWMPNNGYIESTIAFTPGESRINMELPLSKWALPLAKPLLDNNGNGQFVIDDEVGLIGVSASRPYQMLSFAIAIQNEEGQLISAISQPFYLGVNKSKNRYTSINKNKQLTGLRLSI